MPIIEHCVAALYDNYYIIQATTIILYNILKEYRKFYIREERKFYIREETDISGNNII